VEVTAPGSLTCSSRVPTSARSSRLNTVPRTSSSTAAAGPTSRLFSQVLRPIQTQPSFSTGSDRGKSRLLASNSQSLAGPPRQQNNYRLDGVSLNDYAKRRSRQRARAGKPSALMLFRNSRSSPANYSAEIWQDLGWRSQRHHPAPATNEFPRERFTSSSATAPLDRQELF